MNEALSILSTATSTITSLYNLIERLPRTFLPSNRGKLKELCLEIESIKDQVESAQESLERSRILITAYSDVVIDVSAAYALANKLSELFRHVSGFSDFSLLFINQSKQDLVNVEYKLRNLPVVDSTELGRLQTSVEQMRRTMQSIASCDLDDSEVLSQYFSTLASEYNSLKLELRGYLNRLIA